MGRRGSRFEVIIEGTSGVRFQFVVMDSQMRRFQTFRGMLSRVVVGFQGLSCRDDMYEEVLSVSEDVKSAGSRDLPKHKLVMGDHRRVYCADNTITTTW